MGAIVLRWRPCAFRKTPIYVHPDPSHNHKDAKKPALPPSFPLSQYSKMGACRSVPIDKASRKLGPYWSFDYRESFDRTSLKPYIL